jgi:hypothetical protein
MIVQSILDKKLDTIYDYLFPPQIYGGRTTLPPSIGSSSAAAVAAIAIAAIAAFF